MTLPLLLDVLGMPAEVKPHILDYATKREPLPPIYDRESYLYALERIGEDEYGFKMLTEQLITCLEVYRRYVDRGIGEDVFRDTFSCFARFVRESVDRYGVLKFDRGWWTYRYLNLDIFRIGSLEYEMTTHDGVKVIQLHIPSDADLSSDKIDISLRDAKRFFAKYYEEYSKVQYRCESWLISPRLKELLPASSKLVGFLDRFVIDRYDPKDMGFLEWVYNVVTDDYSVDTLPEDTTLRRLCKQLLKNGESIGAGYGYIADIMR